MSYDDDDSWSICCATADSKDRRSISLNLKNIRPPKLILVMLAKALDVLSRMLDSKSKIESAYPKRHQPPELEKRKKWTGRSKEAQFRNLTCMRERRRATASRLT